MRPIARRKEHTGVDDESGRAQFAHVPEDLIELSFVAGSQYMSLQSKFVCSRLHFPQTRLGESPIGRVDELARSWSPPELTRVKIPAALELPLQLIGSRP